MSTRAVIVLAIFVIEVSLLATGLGTLIGYWRLGQLAAFWQLDDAAWIGWLQIVLGAVMVALVWSERRNNVRSVRHGDGTEDRQAASRVRVDGQGAAARDREQGRTDGA